MKNPKLIAGITFFLFFSLSAYSQALISGKVTGVDGEPVFLANIAIEGINTGTMTDQSGNFSLIVPSGKNIEITVSCVGYLTQNMIRQFDSGEKQEINITLKQVITELDEASISVRREKASTFSSIDISALSYLPNTSASVESIIKTMPGVSSNNELSSQYSVRGGNYDENLIYVNDIEIYRPFLVRSGQQEGLSFINSDLISSIRFSAGGFDAQYGDKMSSVLDITYRKPEAFGGAVSASLLGGAVQLEGISQNGKFSAIGGIRYKTTAYLLNSLETEGEYKPRFGDIQGLLSYRPGPKLSIDFLGNASLNQYNFIPVTRNTEFGTASTPLNLKIYFEGQEIDRYDTYLGALSVNYTPVEALKLKFITSAFSTAESETFDILGEYLINELDNTIGSETYGDSILNIGIGAFLNHARNYLDAKVYSFSHLGVYDLSSHRIRWGAKLEYQEVADKISEWEMIDSAGYSVPSETEEVLLHDVIKAENRLQNTKLSAFFQNTWSFSGRSHEYFITAGIRSAYLSLSRQLLISPRFTISLQPEWEKDIMFHLSSGLYYQPPFYKEMRNPEGILNKNLKAQQSVHMVAGGDYIFRAWERPFKFSAEAYYKYLNHLVPYKVENVRISYAGENLAHGYAMGLDFKLNGEFVPGAESWMSLSFLRTREDIKNDVYTLMNNEGESFQYRPGFYPRPADQLMTFSLFFQDYFPNNPDYKVSLNFLYGSRLPYGSPDKNRYDDVYRLPPYRRVDIGFSKVILKETESREGNVFRSFKNVWISAEIFNLLGINNTISYLWVRTISNQQSIPDVFAVPNYLTSRRFNLKLTAKF